MKSNYGNRRLLRARRKRPRRRAAEKRNETHVAAFPHPSSAASIVSAQTSTLIGLKPASKPLPQCRANVADGSCVTSNAGPHGDA